jgi:hypothetical protein
MNPVLARLEENMSLFRLSEAQQREFARYPEIFPGAQLGFVVAQNFERQCLIACDQIAVYLDDRLAPELDTFFESVWRRQEFARPFGNDEAATIIRLYTEWMNGLPEAHDAIPMATVPRGYLMGIVTNTIPPPPPTRPSVVPGAPHGRGSLPSTPAHLPFHAVTRQGETFYRWEAWPTSLRVHPVSQQVDPWTFAGPEAELKLIETGFAAVARAALPSFFPHVFRWKLEPPLNTSMLCGAVVPMYVQAGGGVEVCFDVGARNTPSSQVVIEPL